MPILVVDSPALSENKEVEFSKSMVIGRAPEVDLQILDVRVSKRHAMVRVLDGRFVLEDLGSSNGTLLDGKPVTAPVDLRPGSVVQVGDSRITLKLEAPKKSESSGSGAPTTMSIRREELTRDFVPADKIATEKQLAADYERLRLAWRISMEIAFDRPMEEQAESIMKILVAEFDADRGVILLAPDRHADSVEPEDMVPIGLVRAGRKDPGQAVKIPSTVLRAVLENKRGVLAADARSDSRFDSSKSVILQGIRSTLVVPLISRGGSLVGVLAMDSTRVVNAFQEKDLVVLETVGAQIATSIENLQLAEEAREQALERERLARVLSPNLVEEVVSGRLKLADGGEARNVTILFTDVRGFTKMSQTISPGEVLNLLNEYLSISVDILFKHQGTLDKFMGDGMMALFSAPMSQPDAALRAAKVACEIRHALIGWNKEREAEGKLTIGVGMGIAKGHVVAGAMGTATTMSYTVIGPAANLSSRLCSAARPGEILVSQEIVDELPRDETEVAEPRMVELKGYANPMPAYGIAMPGIADAGE